jgi:hypothetical protein
VGDESGIGRHGIGDGQVRNNDIVGIEDGNVTEPLLAGVNHIGVEDAIREVGITRFVDAQVSHEQLVGADIAVGALRARDAALVGSQAVGIIPGIEGRAGAADGQGGCIPGVDRQGAVAVGIADHTGQHGAGGVGRSGCADAATEPC